jgi:DNA-binding GntR family transcriptional regulator
MVEPTPIRPNLGGDGHPLDRKQATETEVAHARLREAILRGELAAGAVLKQGQLAEEFGVGRTPLREALRLLEREGLVEVPPQRRARVADFSVEDLEQLYAMRIELETLGARFTVPGLREAELDALEENLARMEEFAEAEDYEGWQVPHRAFHFGLVAHVGDRVLKLISQLSDHAERYRHVYTVETPRGWARGIPEHRAILDAAKDRDPVATAERLARHYGTVSLSLIAMMAPDREPSLLRTALRAHMRSENASGRRME